MNFFSDGGRPSCLRVNFSQLETMLLVLAEEHEVMRGRGIYNIHISSSVGLGWGMKIVSNHLDYNNLALSEDVAVCLESRSFGDVFLESIDILASDIGHRLPPIYLEKSEECQLADHLISLSSNSVPKGQQNFACIWFSGSWESALDLGDSDKTSWRWSKGSTVRESLEQLDHILFAERATSPLLEKVL